MSFRYLTLFIAVALFVVMSLPNASAEKISEPPKLEKDRMKEIESLITEYFETVDTMVWGLGGHEVAAGEAGG